MDLKAEIFENLPQDKQLELKLLIKKLFEIFEKDSNNLHKLEENINVLNATWQYIPGYNTAVLIVLNGLDSSTIEQKFTKLNLDDTFKRNFLNLKKINNLKFNLEENTYYDYRQLIVIIAQDYRVLITLILNRYYNMEKRKKDNFPLKFYIGRTVIEIFTPLAHRLGLGDIKTKLEELSLYYIDREAYKDIVNLLEIKKQERQSIVEDFIIKNKVMFEKEFPNNTFKIYGRPKSIYSIYKKTIGQGKDFEEIHDILGIRILTNTVEECYTVLSLIHSKFELVENRFKDYIKHKKQNLYQSLHTTIITQDNQKIEIQIRTYEMHEIAEKGIAAHWLYKEGRTSKDSNDIEEQLHLFREMLEKNDIDEKIKNNMNNEIFSKQIYTFTPGGKIIILPVGATVVDFAFKVHSNIAKSMYQVLINNKLVPFSTKLDNEDVIEIKTKKNYDAITKEWLDLATTSRALKKIKSFLNKEKEKIYLEKIQEGMSILKHMYQKEQISINFAKGDEEAKKVLQKINYPNVEKVAIDVANNDFDFKKLNGNFQNEPNYKFKKDVDSLKKYDDINVIGAEDIKITFAKCCLPVYGDDVVGAIANGKSIRIHRKDCYNLKNTLKQIDANWTNENSNNKYLTKIELISDDRENLINDIIGVFSKSKIPINNMDFKNQEKKIRIVIRINVKNSTQLYNSIKILLGVKGVLSVTRI